MSLPGWVSKALGRDDILSRCKNGWGSGSRSVDVAIVESSKFPTKKSYCTNEQDPSGDSNTQTHHDAFAV